MKRILVFTLLATSLYQAASAQPRRYSIQPNTESRLEVHVFKTGLYRGKSHTFVFPNYKATLLYDQTTPEQSRIDLTLSAAAIRCIDTWLNAKDLKSVRQYAEKEMLAVERYPEILFSSSQVRSLGGDRFEVRGMLTIRGLAKPSVIDVTIQHTAGDALTFRGTATVRLTDYGLKPPKAILGAVGTKDEMEFSFTLEGVGRDANDGL